MKIKRKLKSYRLKGTFAKAARTVKKIKPEKPIGTILTGGITALIGTAFVAQTAGIINKL